MSGIGLQLAHYHVLPHQHVQLHHLEVLGRLQVLILIYIRFCYLGPVHVFDS
jgi:hypothetical protein